MNLHVVALRLAAEMEVANENVLRERKDDRVRLQGGVEIAFRTTWRQAG
jgi:hypothetical protein